MTEKEKVTKGISRRDFLKDASLLVGGTAIGSTVLLAACGGGETTTVTTTAGATTVTVTESKFIDPIDGMEFDTLAELQAHFEAAHPAEGAILGIVTLNVNGRNHTVHVEPDWPLTFVLREKLGLVGTKVGCDRGECGSCTIIVDGRSVYACTMLAIESGGMEILTIEGLADGSTLHPVQQLYRDTCTFQCGYCTPGMIMSTIALLDKHPNPTRAQVKEGISGNCCFCVDYTRIINTILKGV
jgi:aerobic-type carbon monoxide dehydrogenase small subunit (CoxS/CutS family)